MTQSVLPGWYPDPKMVNTLRYWDGTEWTQAVAPQQQQNPLQITVDPVIVVDIISTLALVVLGGLIKVVSPKPAKDSDAIKKDRRKP